MSQLMFYQRIVPLNKDQHRNLRLKPLTEGAYRYAAETPFVPLAGTEFMTAARQLPILFSGDPESCNALALMGLNDGSNLFVDESGNWPRDTYIPAFIRRYPFVIAGKDGDENFTVCIDADWQGFNEEDGERLFEDSGEQTPYLGRVLGFVQQYHAEMQATQAFIKRLTELELLIRRDLQLTGPDGKTAVLRDFRVIDESKFVTLPGEQIVEFHEAGWLPWVYAHLMSLANLTALHQRLAPAPASASANTLQ